MYLFDPDRGRRRGALMRDQLISATSHLDDAIEATARDLIHRAQGPNGRGAVEHAGMIQFERVNGGTRLDVEMSYSPPGGVLGDVVAKLFGADPKTELDDGKSATRCGRQGLTWRIPLKRSHARC
ncbi:MAG: hypothetical protein ACREVY_14105 [Gammaproteobacteria bacterium]